MPLANILMPRPRSTGEFAAIASSRFSRETGARLNSRRDGSGKPRAVYLSRALAIFLSVALLAAVPLDVPAQKWSLHSPLCTERL